ncbi:MAG: helix-turn-helix domain-containing protein [bacterium]
MNAKPDLLTPEELARELRVPKSWVYSRTRTNAIPVLRFGKYCRFRLTEVLQSLECQSQARREN